MKKYDDAEKLLIKIESNPQYKYERLNSGRALLYAFKGQKEKSLTALKNA